MRYRGRAGNVSTSPSINGRLFPLPETRDRAAFSLWQRRSPVARSCASALSFSLLSPAGVGGGLGEEGRGGEGLLYLKPTPQPRARTQQHGVQEDRHRGPP